MENQNTDCPEMRFKHHGALKINRNQWWQCSFYWMEKKCAFELDRKSFLSDCSEHLSFNIQWKLQHIYLHYHLLCTDLVIDRFVFSNMLLNCLKIFINLKPSCVIGKIYAQFPALFLLSQVSSDVSCSVVFRSWMENNT